MEKIKKIELLAPAGSMETFIVAINCGADAVYISGKKYGARASALNFTNEEIIKAVEYAHLRGKKVYVTINTLIFDDELSELKEYLDFLYLSLVDAIIVQDLGVLYYLKEKYPDWLIHVSTQMSIFNTVGMKNLKAMGVARVILARELSLVKIQELSDLGVETEVFVHGAMCYAYSGNCLLSYVIGKRSGNRGECAQPCRKLYQLVENGKTLCEEKALLSMKDLFTVDYLDQLILANVTSLKIEGRLKSKEYVKEVITLYRKKIDEYYSNGKIKPTTPQELSKLKVTFNRGFTKGYIFSEDNNQITTTKQVNHQGILIGKVIAVVKNRISIKLTDSLFFGDGIRFKGKNESGLYVNEIYLHNELVKKANRNDVVTILVGTKFLQQEPIELNCNVYKTFDSSIMKECEEILKTEPTKIGISMEFYAHYLEPLQLKISDGENSLTITHDLIEEKSEKAIDVSRIEEQLRRINNTCCVMQNVIIDYDNIGYIPIKKINEIRRMAIDELSKIRVSTVRRVLLENELIGKNNGINKEKIDKQIEIEAVVENAVQAQVCLECGIKTIYDLKANCPRFGDNVLNHGLIHNIGQINGENSYFVPSIYMNLLNHWSIEYMMKLGFSTAYLSTEYDLLKSSFNYNNLGINVGILVYGNNDIMVTNHCLIAKEKGYQQKQCQSCLNHDYELVDRYGNHYQLIGNYPQCDIRILNNQPINIINKMPEFIKQGINKYLLIFTNENEHLIRQIIRTVQNQIKK